MPEGIFDDIKGEGCFEWPYFYWSLGYGNKIRVILKSGKLAIKWHIKPIKSLRISKDMNL